MQLDFTGENLGFKVGIGFLTLTSALRVYGKDTRLYLQAEAAAAMLVTPGVGGGIGWDIPLGKNQKVVVQPQMGVQAYKIKFIQDMLHASGSVSVNWGAPRSKKGE